MKVSVIVPVYNAKNTIIACLGNLLNQSLSDMEIILVDDASTDGTDAILRDAKNQFPDKVRVFRQEANAGPGVARNLGIEVAQGDYIGFVDADDVVDVTMYEKLYATATSVGDGADIADCAFYRESQDQAFLHFEKELMGKLSYDAKNVLISSGGFVWSKIFKKDLLDSAGLRFRPSYGLEDMDFLIKAIASAKTAASTDEVLYMYHDSTSSLSKEVDFGKYYQNHLGAMMGIFEKMSVLNDYDSYRDACEYAMVALYSNILKLAYKKKDEIPRELLSELLEGLRTVRFSCIKNPVTKNPYLKKFDDESMLVVKLCDESVDTLLNAK